MLKGQLDVSMGRLIQRDGLMHESALKGMD